MNKSIKILFFINGIFNGVGALILFFGTKKLSDFVGTNDQTNFIWHLLGACSLSLAILSFFTIKVKEKFAILVSILTFWMFNLSTAVISVITIINGGNNFVIINTTMHLILFIIFTIFGIIIIRDKKI